MMDWTDRHCRSFHRSLTRGAILYTEMVTADAVLHGDREKLLGHDEAEHPVILQLGGSDPQKLAEAARVGEGAGYDGINLNCGCPSDRVQSGAFGAILMQTPDIVADCIDSMQEAVRIPVSVKCRIGVDKDDPAIRLPAFVDTVAQAGCDTFVIHARKAWLKGLSPRENRDIPPLDYGLVKMVKAARPDLKIILNGGIRMVSYGSEMLTDVTGVMFGRAAYQNPLMLAEIDPVLRGETPGPGTLGTALAAVEAYRPYIAARLAEGVPLHRMTRHMLGLFNGMPGARAWRRTLSVHANREGAGLDVLDAALAMVIEPAEEMASVDGGQISR